MDCLKQSKDKEQSMFGNHVKLQNLSSEQKISFSEKLKTSNSSKKVEQKVDNGHPQWSPAPVLTKTDSTFTAVGTQRVAAVVARSALQ